MAALSIFGTTARHAAVAARHLITPEGGTGLGDPKSQGALTPEAEPERRARESGARSGSRSRRAEGGGVRRHVARVANRSTTAELADALVRSLSDRSDPQKTGRDGPICQRLLEHRECIASSTVELARRAKLRPSVSHGMARVSAEEALPQAPVCAVALTQPSWCAGSCAPVNGNRRGSRWSKPPQKRQPAERRCQMPDVKSSGLHY